MGTSAFIFPSPALNCPENMPVFSYHITSLYDNYNYGRMDLNFPLCLSTRSLLRY